MPVRLERLALQRGEEAALLAQLGERIDKAKRLAWQSVGGDAAARGELAQQLSQSRGLGFTRLSLASAKADPRRLQTAVARLFSFARSHPTVLFFDEADALFGKRSQLTADQNRLASYIRGSLPRLPGVVSVGFNDEPGTALNTAASLHVEFPPPGMGPVDGGRDKPVPARGEEALLPQHRFGVMIDGEDIGFCQVSAPSVEGGFLSGVGFDTRQGDPKTGKLPDSQLALWPTLVLRRALTQSKALYDWRMALIHGKPALKPVELLQYDASGERIVHRWRLQDCWPRRWTGPAFNSLEAGVSCEELELYYRAVDWL